MNVQELLSQIKTMIAAALEAVGLNPGQRNQVRQLVREVFRESPAGMLQGKHYILQVDVDFTSTTNEEKPKQTKGVERDLLIVGAITNLDHALVKITDDSTGYSFSNQRVNVKALAGRSGNAVPVLPWKEYFLERGRTLSLDFKNGAAAADAAGFFALVAVQLEPRA